MTYVELYEQFQAKLKELLEMADVVHRHPCLREVMRCRMLPVAEDAVAMWKQLAGEVR